MKETHTNFRRMIIAISDLNIIYVLPAYVKIFSDF